MRKFSAVFILLLLCILCGCSSLMEGDYHSITDHIEASDNQETTACIYEIHTFAGLKNAVQGLVNSAAEQGIIRAVEYSGAISEDISRVCLDVTRESPIGSYAVEYITHTVTRILTYDEIDIHISYKLNSAEIAALRSIPTVSDYYQLIDRALDSGASQLAAQLVTLSVNEQTIKNYVENYYCNHPEKLLYKPSVAVSFFPSVDYVQKIAVLEFQYYSTDDQRSSDLSDLLEQASALTADCNASRPEEIAMLFCSRIASDTAVQSKGRTAHDVLVKKSGNSEGCAMAFQLLCNLCDIPCRVVVGRLNGNTCYWNIIQIGQYYYHVDCYESMLGDISDHFMKNDSQMKEAYWWEQGEYPECIGPMTYETVLAGYYGIAQQTASATDIESELSDAAQQFP